MAAFGGIGRALSSRNYRIYWIGAVVSTLGFWIYRMSLGWLAWELSKSPAWLGAMAFASVFPAMATGPLAGALADTFGPRRIAMTAMVVATLNAMLIVILVYVQFITVEWLLLLASIQGIAMSFDFPARHALISSLVDRSNLSAAIALHATTFQAGSVVGPAIGGITIKFLGIEATFAIAAATIFWMFCAMLFVRVAENKVDRKPLRNLFGEIAAGIRYTFHEPSIRWVLTVGFFGGLLVRPFVDLLPGFADDVFNRGADGLAILLIVSGLGALMGSGWLAYRDELQRLTSFIVWGLVVGAVLIFAFALIDDFYLAQFVMFLGAMALIISMVSGQTLIQHAVEPGFRSRAISIAIAANVGGIACGGMLLGLLGDLIGLQKAVAFGAGSAVILIALTGPILLRHATTLEREHHRER